MASTNPLKVWIENITETSQTEEAADKIMLLMYVYYTFSACYYSPIEGHILLDGIKDDFSGFTLASFEKLPKGPAKSFASLSGSTIHLCQNIVRI